jgi:hypothetical protein
VENSILHPLESKIEEALAKIADLSNRNKKLQEEKSELLSQLTKQKLIIERLEKAIRELQERSSSQELEQYKENEEQLRERIQKMIAKLSELEKLD